MNAIELSTEEKIKEAAKTVFLKKGFSGTKTRDIADEAGENLALINYYFRSKENLFQIVMNEIANEFMTSLIPILNDTNTTILEKVESLAKSHIDLFLSKPAIPIFIMHELSEGRGCAMQNDLNETMALLDTEFHRQVAAEYKNINPEHMVMNIYGMIIFPFLGRVMMSGVDGIDDAEFAALMEERKRMIPVWSKAILSECNQ